MTLHPSFISPQYASYCFSNIPETVLSLFSGTDPPRLPADVFGNLPQRYDTVILFYIDAFGWRFYERYAGRSPLLSRIRRDGAVSMLTAQFPSTTAAHVTSIHFGLTAGQSGVFEWQYYEPLVDAMIAPLPFSFAGSKQPDTLKSTGIPPGRLFPEETVYQRLQQRGVRSHALQHGEYTPSTYSNIAFQGAHVTRYRTFPEALVNLRLMLERQDAPSYYFLYFDRIDAIGHHYGPASPHIDAEIEISLAALDLLFFKALDGRINRTLVILTADHGMVEIDLRTTVYLNRDARFDGIERYLKTNRQGQFLVPGGSPRDLFLYVHDDALAEAQAFLADRLEGRAEVAYVRELIDRGFFGPPPVSQPFLSRVGNLVILPYAGESVWWYEKGRFEQKFYGHHGGLTRQEMEIPLLLYAFG